MSAVIAWDDLKARLAAAAITSGGVLVPIAYPNTAFSLPTSTRPWLRVEMAGNSSVPVELGARVWQDEGQAIVHVLVPTGSGMTATNLLADALKDCFRGPPWDSVIYVRVAADSGGPGDDDGLYYVSSVRADWRLHTINQSRS